MYAIGLWGSFLLCSAIFSLSRLPLLPSLLLLLARSLLRLYLFPLLTFALALLMKLVVLGLYLGFPGLGVAAAAGAVILLAGVCIGSA
jgi:hypothetical protein